MPSLGLTLLLVVHTAASQGFRTRLVVEEGDKEVRYLVDFRPGEIRVEPDEAGVHLFIDVRDVSAPRITWVNPDKQFYCRLGPEEYRRLVSAGIVDPSWFPWVSRVSADLLEEVSLEAKGRSRVPGDPPGRQGLRYVVHSKPYDRLVAEYWLDRNVSPELFFQWKDIYLQFWGEEEPDVEPAQAKRLELYGLLPGLPLVSKERFAFLSRPRIMRLESREKIPEGAFTIPEEYREKNVNDLYWESFTDRLLRWLGVDKTPGTRGPP